jgi:hypothetical protein
MTGCFPAIEIVPGLLPRGVHLKPTLHRRCDAKWRQQTHAESRSNVDGLDREGVPTFERFQHGRAQASAHVILLQRHQTLPLLGSPGAESSR